MRIALIIEYDGTAFHGWQSQLGLRTVQSTLAAALSKIADQPVQVVCAGRTDTGVHATHQVVHFDTTVARMNHVWTVGTNHFLPNDVSVRHACPVQETFHARFSALSRSYEYWIDNRRTKPALQHKKLTWIPRPLDAQKMHDAAQQLLGMHDFSAFRAAHCQAKHPVRTLISIEVTRQDHLIVLRVTANGFLHHMVRNIVGTLLPIGFGEAPLESMQTILEGQKRACAGITAPADGLYLSHVAYEQPLHFVEKVNALMENLYYNIARLKNT